MNIEHFTKLNCFVLFILMMTPILVSESHAQRVLPVHEEPFHKPIFEIDAYRILQVTLHPGDTSDFHLHSSPILYISLDESPVYLNDKGELPRTVTLPNGWIGSDFYSESEFLVHRIAPAGKLPLRVLAFQIKEHLTLSQDSIASDFDFQENGFTVRTRRGISDYFESHSIPLVVKSGEIKIGTIVYNRGSLISEANFSSIKEKLPLEQLTYWQVGFTAVQP